MTEPKARRIPFNDEMDRRERDTREGMGVWWRCFEKYCQARQDIADNEQPGKSFQDVRVTLTRPELELLTMGTLGVVGGMVLWGGVGVSIFKYLNRQAALKGAKPLGRFAQGSLVTLQAVTGTALTLPIYGKLYKEYGTPLVIEDRHCPAYFKFEPCQNHKNCVEWSKQGGGKHFLDGYLHCKRRAEEQGGSSINGDFSPQSAR